jgi:hypothetical protein
LRFTTAECRPGLPKSDVTEPDIRKGHQGIEDLGHGAEERYGFVHRHLQDIGDIQALVCDFQRFAPAATIGVEMKGFYDKARKAIEAMEEAL